MALVAENIIITIDEATAGQIIVVEIEEAGAMFLHRLKARQTTVVVDVEEDLDLIDPGLGLDLHRRRRPLKNNTALTTIEIRSRKGAATSTKKVSALWPNFVPTITVKLLSLRLLHHRTTISSINNKDKDKDKGQEQLINSSTTTIIIILIIKILMVPTI